ncbi:putative Cytochrome P450 [Quillaja saponaria]|uniref:Cytochrome P450 n=1 Tax=Quillaja saponaria TaxID=32244 RepID=A0AAD7LKH7_QUISA|nr:putative Cytochrome P450 [Quillaja saponaria]
MDVLSVVFEVPPSIIIIIITLIAILGGYFKLRVSPLLGKKIPPGSLGFPVIGESVSFIKAQRQDKTGEWLQSRISKYGPVFKTSLMGSNSVVLTGQAGNRFLFSGSDNGIAGNQVATAAKILGKQSIFEVSGFRHKLVRSAITGFLKPESIQRFVGEMDSLVQQQLLQELNDKDSVRMVELMKKTAFKVTCSLLCSLPEGNEQDELFKDFTIAAKGFWAIPLNIPGTTYHKALQARNRLHKRISSLIKGRKKLLEEGMADSSDDIIISLLSLRDESGEPLPEEEIIDNVISVMLASHDTTAIVLSLLIRQLSRDTEVFNKVLEEQKQIVNAKEGSEANLNWADLQMMKYTWRVALELMRITPPVFGNFKSASRDTNFDGFDILKGWKVLWVAAGTNMDKNIFEDPEKFDPSRFERSLKSFPPYTYVPFGAGPRICPGAEFARVEILLIVHHLITNYNWKEMIPDEPIMREPLPYPSMGLPVKLHQRNVTKKAVI